jgi:hypothetical protein
VTDSCGHACVDRTAALACAVAVSRSKGGRRQNNKMGMFRWGMEGAAVAAPFFRP